MVDTHQEALSQVGGQSQISFRYIDVFIEPWLLYVVLQVLGIHSE